MSAKKLSPHTNPLLNKDFVNCFVTAVKNTFQITGQTPVQIGTARIEADANFPSDVTGVIGISAGTLRGTLSIALSKECAFEVMQNLLGETHPEVNEAVADAVGELTNQIYGSARTEINKLGFSFQAAIPTVLRGSFTMKTYHKGATLVIPFQTLNKHPLHLAITVEEDR